jgi:hypothetical protein
MQHYPVFFENHELRAGESEAMLNKEDPSFGIILPVRQQFFGTPGIHSDDAAWRKVWKRIQVFFAHFGIEKRSLAPCE